jgi:putative endonuclease
MASTGWSISKSPRRWTRRSREKQLKRYRREWKRNLIERENPAWNDLAVGFGLEPLETVADGAVDPGTRPG